MAEPGFREPMLATLSEAVPGGEDWVFERKLDGIRLVVVRDGEAVQLFSRNHKDRTGYYPELVEALLCRAPPRFVADGEVVAFEGNLTSFSRLQQRSDADGRAAPIHLYLFDLLHHDGDDLTHLPLRQRKQVLREVVDFTDPIRFSPHRNNRLIATGRTDGDPGSAGDAGWSGGEYLAEACTRGWEGLIAKRGDGRYVHGRSRDWLKLKCVAQQEFVIGGFTEPAGSRTALGALLVGYHDRDGTLRYAGRVGTGFDDAELRRLRGRLAPDVIDEPPFRDAPDRRDARGVHWVAPTNVCEVGFTEWTTAGRLRHPRYLGLRDDKPASEVVRERPGGGS